MPSIAQNLPKSYSTIQSFAAHRCTTLSLLRAELADLVVATAVLSDASRLLPSVSSAHARSSLKADDHVSRVGLLTCRPLRDHPEVTNLASLDSSPRMYLSFCSSRSWCSSFASGVRAAEAGNAHEALSLGHLRSAKVLIQIQDNLQCVATSQVW